jgi:hypothetical protein
MKRMMTRARGSGSTIRKRTAHIRIVLTDEIEIKKREKKSSGAKKKKKTGAKAKQKTTTAPNEMPEAAAPEATASEEQKS